MARARRCSTASIAGANGAFGKVFSRRSRPAVIHHWKQWWTARPCAPTARLQARKGGARPGDRPLARWSHHQDPRTLRCRWSALRFAADRRQCTRHHWCPRSPRSGSDAAVVDWRQGLWRRGRARLPHPARLRGCHSAQGRLPQPTPIRSSQIQEPQHHRAFLQPIEGLARYCHSLRQGRNFLSGICLAAAITYWAG
jgi:hypothetical protein